MLSVHQWFNNDLCSCQPEEEEDDLMVVEEQPETYDLPPKKRKLLSVEEVSDNKRPRLDDGDHEEDLVIL